MHADAAISELVRDRVVAALAQLKKIPTDSTIFHEGDDADAVFVVDGVDPEKTQREVAQVLPDAGVERIELIDVVDLLENRPLVRARELSILLDGAPVTGRLL